MFECTGINDHTSLRSAIKSYDCTSEDDIAKLPKFGKAGTQVLNDGRDEHNNAPCGYGSIAIVKGGNVYKLFPDNEWSVF